MPATTVPGKVIVVADPRPGDLRTDEAADVLPITYVARPAAVTRRDVPYGSDPAQTLDLYLPASADAPVVVFLHSGGWVGGDKQNVPEMVLRFVERGYAVASVGYRLAPQHPFPAAVHDVHRAIRWLKTDSAVDGAIDPDSLVLYGASAGGHLAAFVGAAPTSHLPGDLPPALAAVDSTVAGIVSAVGPTDLISIYEVDNAWAAGFTAAFVACDPCGPTKLAEASPNLYLHSELPPAYWAYGELDGLVEWETQGLAIAEGWAAAAGPAASWLDVVNGVGHNLDQSIINQRQVEAFVDFAVS